MTLNWIEKNQALGDIVAAYPSTAELFEKLGLDFCCGGQRLLAEEIAEHGLDEKAVLEALQEAVDRAVIAGESFRDWRQVSFEELTEHITRTHHDYLRKELPHLREYVFRIAKVHGPTHGDVLRPLAEKFDGMQRGLAAHIEEEDAVLFPLIVRYEAKRDAAARDQALKELGKLEAEHEAVGDALKEMRALTNGFTLPEDACATYMLTFSKLEELERDMFRHVHLENHILFPRLEVGL